MSVVREALMLTTVTCHGCGAVWSFCRELVWAWDTSCCGPVVSVKQVPWQRLFCDEGGSWTRRRGDPSPRARAVA